MRRLVDLVKLHRMDQMIRSKTTGAPKVFAERLEMSRSSLFELIAFLKEEMKAPIIYNKQKKSYVYSYPPKFYLGFDRLEPAKNKKSKNKLKEKVENDNEDYDFLLDDDIDFTDLYY